MITQRQNNWLTVVFIVGLMAVMLSSCGNSDPPKSLVSEIYIVQSGDTLWTISAKFMEKNTYGRRDIREFYQGIIELNYDLFENRTPGFIKPGDKLQINYWVKEKAAPSEKQPQN